MIHTVWCITEMSSCIVIRYYHIAHPYLELSATPSTSNRHHFLHKMHPITCAVWKEASNRLCPLATWLSGSVKFCFMPKYGWRPTDEENWNAVLLVCVHDLAPCSLFLKCSDPFFFFCLKEKNANDCHMCNSINFCTMTI